MSRYVDKVKFYQVSFIGRNHFKYLWFITCLLLLLNLCSFLPNWIEQFNILPYKLVMWFTKALTSGLIIVTVLKLVNLVIAAELQSAIFSNALKHITQAFYIVGEDKSLVYFDSRLSQEKQFPKNENEFKDFLEHFFQNAFQSKLHLKLEYKNYIWEIFPLLRPENYFLITAKNKGNILLELLEKHNVGYYEKDNTGKCIQLNKPLKQLLKLEVNNTDVYLKEFLYSKVEQGYVQFFLKKNNIPVRVSEIITSERGEKLYGLVSGFSFAENIFKFSPLPIAYIHTSGSLIYNNSAFLQLSKLNDEVNLKELLIDDISVRLIGIDELSISVVKFKKGPYVRMYLNRVSDDFVGYFIDITEEIELKAQLSHAQKISSLGQLAGGIAHDFNNLLTAITGFCDLLLMNFNSSDVVYEDVIQIKNNAERGRELVKKILAFSRKQKLDIKVIDLAKLLLNLSVLLNRLLGPDIKLVISCEDELGYVKADYSQLEQIIINLAVNARDAMLGKGILTISLANVTVKNSDIYPLGKAVVVAPGDYVLIKVEDTGCGIPAEIIEKIFDPFFSTKDQGKGTGLGLSTIQGAINQMGGYISVESELKKGSIFSMLLHRTYSKLNIEKENIPVTSSPKLLQATILVVEDENSIREFTVRALKLKNYNVLQASSGREALDIFNKSTVDIVLTDIIMPDLNGADLAEQLLKLNSKLKIILTSGYTKDKLENKKILESCDFLLKPFNLRQLLEVVEKNAVSRVDSI